MRILIAMPYVCIRACIFFIVTSYRLVLIPLCLLIGGCQYLEVYYKPSESALRTYIESPAISEETKALAQSIWKSMELRILQTGAAADFQVKVLSTFDPSEMKKLISGSAGNNISPLEIERLTRKLEVLDQCDYFDERNWNCGDRERVRDDLVMKNGQLYMRGGLLERHYKLNFQK